MCLTEVRKQLLLPVFTSLHSWEVEISHALLSVYVVCKEYVDVHPFWPTMALIHKMWSLGLYSIFSSRAGLRTDRVALFLFCATNMHMYISQQAVTSFYVCSQNTAMTSSLKLTVQHCLFTLTHWYLSWSDICILLPSLLHLQVCLFPEG